MADLEKIVKLIFEGDGKGLSTEMAKMDKDFTGFTNKIKDATGPLGDFGMGVAKAEAALIALAVAGMAVAIQKAGEFETAVSKITAVTSDEELAGFGNLNDALLEMGNTSTKPIVDIAAALADAKGAGYGLSEAFDIVSGAAERLSVVGDTSLQTAFNVIDSSLKNFKSSAGDADEAASTIFKTFDLGKISIEEIEKPFASAAGVVAAAGLSFDDFNAAIAYLTSTGMAPANAIDAIKSACANILKPSEQAKDMAEKLGINFSIAGVNANGFSGFLETLQRTASKEDLAKLFGDVQGLNGMLKLTTAEGLPVFNRMLGEIQDSADPLADKFEDMKNRLDNVWQTTVNNIDGALIKSAMPMLESFKGVVSGLGGVFIGLQDSVDDDTFKPITDAINKFFNDTKVLFSTFAKNLPEALEGVDFSKLVQSFKDLGGEIGEALDALFGGELYLTTVEGLEDAIQKIVDIATKMTKFTEGFVDGLKPMLRIIGEITDSVTGMDDATVKSFGNMSGTSKIINELTGKLQLLEGAIYTITAASSITAIKTLGITFSQVMVGVAGVIAGIGVLAGGAIGVGIGTLINQIEPVREKVQELAADLDKLTNWTGNQSGPAPKFLPDFDDLTPGTQKFLNFFLGDTPEPVVLAFKPETQTLDDSLTLPIFQDGIDIPTKWVFDKDAPEQLLDDLLSIPMIEDGINLPIWAKLEDEALQKDIAAASKDGVVIAGKMSFDGKTWFEIEEEFKTPVEKPVELKPTILEQAKLDLERELNAVDNQAKTVQTAMEWEAKINIADIEGSSKIATEAFSTIGASVVETSSGITEMFSDLASGMNNMRTSDKWFMMDRLQEAQDKNSELIDSQIKLTEQQAEYMRLRNEKIENGETAEIKIDTTGVEPAIEMVMWNIIEKVQIRANENAQEFLLGLPTV
ncbi:MAG: phage tail tape measure protein [Smithella sp.]